TFHLSAVPPAGARARRAGVSAGGGRGAVGPPRPPHDSGKNPVKKAATNVTEWKDRHKSARARDDAGDYEGALDAVIGAEKPGTEPTGESFDNVDAALDVALTHELSEFKSAAQDGKGAMAGLPVGAAVLAVLGAAAAVLGIGRRLSEYR
ncbi:hypothetical protein ACFWJH_02270, partial [Streptomyces lasiicapitis]